MFISLHLSCNLSVHVLREVIHQALLVTVYLIHNPENKNTNNSDKSIVFFFIWNNCTVLLYSLSSLQDSMIFDWEILYMSVGECSVFGYDLNIGSLLTKTMSKIAFLKCLRCRYAMINMPDSSSHAEEDCDMSPRGICFKIKSIHRVNGEVISSFSFHYSPAFLYL